MKTLVSFPGRAGDIAWALPTVRAIAEAVGEPVDFIIAGEFDGLIPILRLQPYLRTVTADSRWSLTPPDEWRTPLTDRALSTYEWVLEIGYRGWPTMPLAQYTYFSARENYPELRLPLLDLHTPWITGIDPLGTATVSVGFTEEWFELKLGLVHCLRRRWQACDAGCTWAPVMGPGRWESEGGIESCDWLTAARLIAASEVFLGCCSAPHVLAVAMGKPVVLMEPSEARRNPIFYPFGDRGPQVTLVRGGDGLPTWDARHVADAVLAARGKV